MHLYRLGNMYIPWVTVLPMKDVISNGRLVHTLGYVDDAALLDTSLQVTSQHVNTIAQGSKDDTDMFINAGKTDFMYVCEQGRCPLLRPTNTDL